MNEEIKVGDFVYVSDDSEEHAHENKMLLFRVLSITEDGCVIVAYNDKYKYAVQPDDVKVMPMDEYKALIENQMPSIENLEAGQELTHHQVLRWIEVHGSTKGLQFLSKGGCWVDGNYIGVSTFFTYRVAPKKVNDPNDPTTWAEGVTIFRRDYEEDAWVLDVFTGYFNIGLHKYFTKCGAYKYAKLATSEQIAAWELIQEGLK